MKIFLLIIFFSIIKANFLTEKLNEFRDKLKYGKMKVNEALNNAHGHWLEFNETLFNVAIKEFGVQWKNDVEKFAKKEKFIKGLAKAQNLKEKDPHAFFGITRFSFMDFDEFKVSWNFLGVEIMF